MMHVICDYTVTDTALDKLIDRFVPSCDLYYFEDDSVLRTLLEEGIPVYTRAEFRQSFPSFSLEYGSLYHLWNLTLPDESFVTLMTQKQFRALRCEVQQQLLMYQIKCGRGHIYDDDWFEGFGLPLMNTVIVDGKSFYFLTSDDWNDFDTELRKKWVLKWLRQWHKDNEGIAVKDFYTNDKSVPWSLIREYAGTFADRSGPNCFASAIAMAVGTNSESCYSQSHFLISKWLHQEPFFRLLHAQGYLKFIELRLLKDFQQIRPADVLVWYTGDGMAGHSAFAVTNELVFQKHGQGWESPWQVLKTMDVWYNEYLKCGGFVAIYRKQKGI